MNQSPDDLKFSVDTPDGNVQGIISSAILRKLAGRSHVGAPEVLSIYRAELEHIVRKKVASTGARSPVRIYAADL